MATDLHTLFTKHPNSVGESYGEHFCFAMRFSGKLFVAAFAALLHAVLPFCCETTASRAVAAMHNKNQNRVANPQVDGTEDINGVLSR